MKKTIKRATQKSARSAMERHVEKMAKKGWVIDFESENDAGCRYECITHFKREFNK